MPEPKPKFERPSVGVFGKIPEEKKRSLSEEIGRRFREGTIEDLPEKIVKEIEALEYDKRLYELDFINASNIFINVILKKSGLEPFDISAKNIHILPPEIYEKLALDKTNSAIHVPMKQLIILNASKHRPNPIKTAGSIFHEMVHLKGFVSFDVEGVGEQETKEKEGGNLEFKRSARRVGLMTFGSYKKSQEKKYYESFRGLNEAVVAELEKIYTDKVVKASNDPEVRKQLEWLESDEVREFKQKVAKNNNMPEEEILWISRDRKDLISRSYFEQRGVLYYLVEEIATEQGMSKEETLNLFIKAHFTGNILAIAKLVEKTFGKNSFFVLGGMDAETTSAIRTLDYLKKQRRLVKKGKTTDL